MEAIVRRLFDRYERTFMEALAGKADIEEVASLYAAEFVAATPAGVMTGKNDAQLRQAMEQGYAHYRAIGTKAMRIRGISISPIDELHCVARVDWTATYARTDQPDIAIDFVVSYFVQLQDGEAKVFGWVSGDEEAVLRERGIV